MFGKAKIPQNKNSDFSSSFKFTYNSYSEIYDIKLNSRIIDNLVVLVQLLYISIASKVCTKTVLEQRNEIGPGKFHVL